MGASDLREEAAAGAGGEAAAVLPPRAGGAGAPAMAAGAAAGTSSGAPEAAPPGAAAAASADGEPPDERPQPAGEHVRLHGITAAPGIAIGRAFILDRRRIKTPKRHIVPEEIEGEQSRMRQAIEASSRQIDRIKAKLTAREGADHFQILEAHQLMLHDEHLAGEALRRVRDERINAEWALRKTVEHIKGMFDEIEDDYFRERRSDIDFVGDRILRNLLGEKPDLAIEPPPDAVVIAHDLSPADTAQLHRAAVAAFATDAGGTTSHTAIMARSLEIPAVVGLETLATRVGNGDLVIVDGIAGEVIVNPPAAVIAEYRQRARKHLAFEEELLKTRDLPAATRDGTVVRLLANVELLDEVPAVLEHGGEGVGLYRTEYLFMGRPQLPSEEEQYQHGLKVLATMGERGVTFRTFDLGGDKVSALATGREANPALGLRSIRLCLKERSLFKTQLRALLRASAHGKVRLMFPMISSLGELRQARAVVDEARAELEREGVAFDRDLPIGVMIEMPAAAITADLLAKEVSFFSIGTNDLIQYALAIDRVNEHVSYLYTPLHPAILRLIQFVVEAGHAAGIRVGMCGEMAGDPLLALVLLGLGVDELSMNIASLPIVKSVVRSSTMREAQAIADAALRLQTAEEIERMLWEAMTSRLPEDVLRMAGATFGRSRPLSTGSP